MIDHVSLSIVLVVMGKQVLYEKGRVSTLDPLVSSVRFSHSYLTN